MHINDLTMFSEIMDRLGQIFGKQPDDALKRSYFDALKYTPLGVVRQCAERHIADAKFFPKPFELKPALAKTDKESKFPKLYSPAWWEGRAEVLRDTFPKGLNAVSRNNLDLATFGDEDCPELRAQSLACYKKAFPWSELHRDDSPEWSK